MALCSLEKVNAGYGDAHVLFDVAMEIEKGACCALLGRNGVGKTTTMRTIVGLTRLRDGDIRWEGGSIAGRAPDAIARAGISLVPEDRRIFASLTVMENLLIAARRPADMPGATAWDVDRILDLFPELRDHLNRRGGYLSGGQQQMLTIARALMSNPKMLLLDEPSEGLAPVIVDRLLNAITALKKTGVTIVLAEQNLWFCLELAERVFVMDRGRLRFSGTPAELRGNTEVQERYLSV
jgi:branched-chain amino acid transport system ATP-binding protein